MRTSNSILPQSLIGLWLVLTLGFTSISFAQEANPIKTSPLKYEDLEVGSKLYEQVNNLENHFNIAPFTTENRFNPEAPMTHLEFATKLNNAFDSILDMSDGKLYAIEGRPLTTKKTGNAKDSLKKLEAAKTDKAYYTVLKNLMKRHGVDLPAELDSFQPHEVLTQKELTSLLKLFSVENDLTKPDMAVTRKDLTSVLNCLLVKNEARLKAIKENPLLEESEPTQSSCY